VRPEPTSGGLAGHSLRRPWLWLVMSFLLLLVWDASGLDLVLTRAVGDAQGFAWRDNWVLDNLFHEGGRRLALVALALLAFDAWRPMLAGPTRRDRLFWWLVVLFSALAIPVLKQASLTSCPWDLAEFGGTAFYRSHWLWAMPDGGPGRCFPSGHAVSAFAFIGQYFLWRGTRPQLARRLLWVVLAVGALFALTQFLRGAHYVSHSLWSAWLCAALALAAASLRRSYGHWQAARLAAAALAG
jgi:membrane-associated PAP2 superfamily phosphatase